MHKHRCPDCGTIWKHNEHCAGRTKAHTCPQCHLILPSPWEHYEGSLKATLSQACHSERVVTTRTIAVRLRQIRVKLRPRAA